MKAWEFGFYSRGEDTQESDIDIMVVLNPSEKVGLKFFARHEELKELLG